MAITNCDGFENGFIWGSGTASGGTVGASTEQSYRGAYSMKCTSDGGGSTWGGKTLYWPGTYWAYGFPEVGVSPTWGIAFHLYVSSKPSAGLHKIWRSNHVSGGANSMWVGMNTSGNITIYDDTTHKTTTTAALSTGTWYCIGIKLVSSTMTVSIWTVPDETLVETITATSMPTDSHNTYLGIQDYDASSGTCTIYIDNLVQSNSAMPTDTMGTKDHCVGIVVGDANGTYNTGYSGSYADMDEIPLSTGDYRNCPYNSTGKFTSAMAAMVPYPGSNPSVFWAVTMFARRASGTPASWNGRWIFRSGSTEVLGTSYDCSGGSDHYYTWETDPATSAAWLESALTNTQVGFEKQGSTGTGGIGDSHYWVGLHVLYTPEAGARYFERNRNVPLNLTKGAYIRPHQRIAGV